MNQLKHITNAPKHRTIYPGEMLLYTNTAYNPLNGTKPHIWTFQLLLQHCVFTVAEKALTKKMVHGACHLIYMMGEPCILQLTLPEGEKESGHELANRDVAYFIREHTADIAFFVGEQLAGEIASLMIVASEAWEDADKPSLDQHGMWLEFTDMSRYNQLFMELRERVGEADGVSFDRAAKVQKLVEFWCASEGDYNVPGQRKWYAEHGPSKDGETAADYAAEIQRFETLVSKGQSAARQLVSV